MNKTCLPAREKLNSRRRVKVAGQLPITLEPGSSDYRCLVAQLSGQALDWLCRAEHVFRVADHYADSLARFDRWREEANLSGLLYAERRIAMGLSMGAIFQLTGITRDRVQRFESGSKPLSTRALCAYERVLSGRPPKGAQLRLGIERLAYRGKPKHTQSSQPSTWVVLDVDGVSGLKLHAACRRLNIKTAELMRALFAHSSMPIRIDC